MFGFLKTARQQGCAVLYSSGRVRCSARPKTNVFFGFLERRGATGVYWLKSMKKNDVLL